MNNFNPILAQFLTLNDKNKLVFYKNIDIVFRDLKFQYQKKQFLSLLHLKITSLESLQFIPHIRSQELKTLLDQIFLNIFRQNYSKVEINQILKNFVKTRKNYQNHYLD